MVLSRKSRSSRKRPAGDLRREVGIGGGEQAHVDLPRARGADALHLATLEHTQQLGLLPRLERADLVQQQRAAFGQLEPADPVAARVGERALHVPEHLALEQAFREPAEVHGHERPGGPRRGGVDPVRHDLLAGPVLAADEHVGVRRRHPLDELAAPAAWRPIRRSARAAPSRRSSRFSLSSRRVRRSARPSSTWVRSVARRRALSHGFSMKSRAPRRIASTALSTLPHAVITTAGSVASRAWSSETSSRPSRPVVVSRA